MPDSEKNIEGFDSPTSLPRTEEQARLWQEANRSWWESRPMRYDWRARIGAEEFSEEFFSIIDERFFSEARRYMPWKRLPFDALIDYGSLRDKDVLEIGVGSGSHARLLAAHARSFTGIDITDYAVRSASARLRLGGLAGRIIKMDAQRTEFGDCSFDFIWSWGVIHHSADTGRILKEMSRILRPGGKAVTMIYHRNTWNYYIIGGLFYGLLRGGFLRSRSLNKIVQMRSDGALARFYTANEWRALASGYFDVEDISVFGQKSDIVPLPAGALKNLAMSLVPDSLGRLLTNRLRLGYFLVSRLGKKPDCL